MATPETLIKNRLNNKDKKIKEAGIAYRRLTFGPNSASGLPDRLINFGNVQVGVEVKRDGKKLTPLQQHKLEEGVKFGVPGMGLIGDEGVDNYYKMLIELLYTDNWVDEYCMEYKRDAEALYDVLENLAN